MKNRTSGSVNRFRFLNISNRLYNQLSHRTIGRNGIRVRGDFVLAEFEDDIDVVFVLETFLVANDIWVL